MERAAEGHRQFTAAPFCCFGTRILFPRMALPAAGAAGTTSPAGTAALSVAVIINSTGHDGHKKGQNNKSDENGRNVHNETSLLGRRCGHCADGEMVIVVPVFPEQ